ncbi:hypothetical protein Ddye_021722 [Dipteronia dyeriana]|uniref:RNase H type-1 domain-containing protein n=1 Tax=Dipteronia dyeriana TaxID=168575 RepID=A0AAD9U2Q9_9ROSI|nr:hypothetical protein Ddye_021722 [Dipteronia dyeriana]
MDMETDSWKMGQNDGDIVNLSLGKIDGGWEGICTGHRTDVQIVSHHNVCWRRTGFYGNPDVNERQHRWTLLLRLSRMSNLPVNRRALTKDIKVKHEELKHVSAVVGPGAWYVIRKVEGELDTLMDQEEAYWRQRSRELCLKMVIETQDGDLNLILDCVEPCLSAGSASFLDMRFSAEEVRKAVFDMHPTKAPGPDGLPTLLYQKFSLCNVFYKIVTKALANRFCGVLNEVISETQSAFIPGRLISDNAIIGFECMHALKRNENMIFTRASERDCHAIKRILQIYSNASGQVINLAKSALCVNKFVSRRQARGFCGSSSSFLWKSIMWDQEIINQGSRWRIGDGIVVGIYSDRWIPRPSTFKWLGPLPVGVMVEVFMENESFDKGEDVDLVGLSRLGELMILDALVGIGIIIRDHLGGVLASCSLPVVAVVSPDVTEATAILRGFIFTKESGLLPCVMESDAQVVVNMINSKNAPLSDIGIIIRDIICFLNCNSECKVVFAPRQGNMAAHKLDLSV